MKEEKTAIKVSDYYGNASYYSVMPHSIFEALEEAFLSDQDTAQVSKELFDEMISDYIDKMRSK